MIDTGIDYTHPVFRYEDGSTRSWQSGIRPSIVRPIPEAILSCILWNRFTAEQINQAVTVK
jgi:hypothetical protein